MTAIETRAYRGTPLFSAGFRPFFLFGALWAGIAVPVWVLAHLLGDSTLWGLPGRDWHVHEMLFGYLAAIITGFLLTAVPNWTGRLPVTGPPLMGLFGLWAIGRVAMLLQARLGVLAAVLDSLFLVVFAAVIWREVLTGRNWRNLPVCAIVTVFAAANVGLHLRAQHPDLASVCERLALGAPAMLIAVIGGRVVPSFTRNWLAQRKAAATPAPRGWFDQAVLATTGLALAVWIAFPESRAAGVLLVAAGPANLARLARWRGLATGREALVWVLHAGYAWLGAALLLLDRPDQSARLVEVHVVRPAIKRRKALRAGAGAAATVADAVRACAVPRHPDEQRPIVAIVGRPPILRVRHQGMEVLNHGIQVEALECLDVVELLAHGIAQGRVLVENPQVQLIGPPVPVRPGPNPGELMGSTRHRALAFAVHILCARILVVRHRIAGSCRGNGLVG